MGRSQFASRSECLPVPLSQVLMAVSPSQRLLKTVKIRKKQCMVRSHHNNKCASTGHQVGTTEGNRPHNSPGVTSATGLEPVGSPTVNYTINCCR